MSINTLPVVASGRRPRGIVQLGPVGSLASVPGWVTWSVSNNSYYEADTFRIVYSTSALPASFTANDFSNQTEIFAQIFGGFPQDPANPQVSELTNLIFGRVDDIGYNPVTREITLTGRDLTAAFIDSRIGSQFKNKTSSQIATQLAQSHGLDTSNITPTKTLAGTYYTRDQVQLASNRSEWDLLSFLAREEGFVVFVSGNSLFFQPDPRPTGAANPYVIDWKQPNNQNGSPVSNVTDLNFGRSLTVAKGISVTARSPNLVTGRAVVQSYPSTPKEIGAGKSSPFGATQQYFFTMAAGKTPTEVAAFAQKTYENIISHEMKMTASMPADDILSISTPVQVQGTGTAFDQLYFPRLVTREMGAQDEGYRMTVEAQNTSPSESPDQ
jgi:hypothetical protein